MKVDYNGLMNLFQSYDKTADVSKMKFVDENNKNAMDPSKIFYPNIFMSKLIEDYKILTGAQNSSNVNDLKLIDELDKIIDALKDNNLQQEIPSCLKNKGKPDLIKISIMKKMTILRTMVNKIFESLGKTFNNDKFQINDYNFSQTFSSGGKTDINVFINKEKASKSFNINLDVNQLFSRPGLETYSILYYKISKEIYRNYSNDKSISLLDSINDLNPKDYEKTMIEKAEEQKVTAEKLLKSYIVSYLRESYPERFKDMNVEVFANMIAKNIVIDIENTGHLGNQEINFSDLDQVFEVQAINKDLIDQITDEELNTFYSAVMKEPDQLKAMRYEKFNSQSQKYLKMTSTSVIGANYLSLAENLMANSSKFKIANHVGFDFNNIDLNDNDFERLKKVCLDYKRTILGMQGIKTSSVPMRFISNPKKPLGSFNDNKTSTLTVNLSRIGSETELFMTLSHELTHAVDAINNKVSGYTNEFGGGLKNDVSESLSGIKKTSPLYQMYKRLNNYCYLLNPNERHARQNEISALMLMMKDKNDLSMDKILEIESSMSNYVQYQNNTVDAIKKVPGFLNNLDIPSFATNEERSALEEKINYLNSIIENKKLDVLNSSQEKENINKVKEMQKQLEDAKNEKLKKDAEEKAKKAELEESSMQLGD